MFLLSIGNCTVCFNFIKISFRLLFIKDSFSSPGANTYFRKEKQISSWRSTYFPFDGLLYQILKNEQRTLLFQQLNPDNGGVFIQILAVILASMVSKPQEYFLRNLFCFKLCIRSYHRSARTIQRRVLNYVYNVRLLSDLHIGDDEFHMLGVTNKLLPKYRLQ